MAGSASFLSPAQEDALKAFVGATLPRSTREVGAIIEREFGLVHESRSNPIPGRVSTLVATVGQNADSRHRRRPLPLVHRCVIIRMQRSTGARKLCTSTPKVRC